jgi:hypothetical protein
MQFRKITREELENLYTHEGITRRELRYLLRISPNQITNRLSEVFSEELNPFKFSDHHELTLRGFIHSPPKKLLKLFNSIHYKLIEEIGQYSLFILSSSPTDLSVATPIIIPKDIAKKSKLSGAHFVELTGKNSNFAKFELKGSNGNFIIAKEINLLGFSELFSSVDTVLKPDDFYGMLRDRFNTPDLVTKSIILWFMSSPIYEARAGGNAFSPISPAESKYTCDIRVLEDFQKDLISVPLPYFSKSKSFKSQMNYITPIKSNLTFHLSPEINYRYEKNLNTANKFLNDRRPVKTFQNSELNISTTTLKLDTIKTRPLESFVQKPVMPAKVLTQTDLPILFTNENLIIDAKETELFEYSMELTQLIYKSHLKLPQSPFEFSDTAHAVKHLMDDIKNSFFELHELMTYGIVFNTGPIGGLGEHLTRISNSILRSQDQINEHEAFMRSEVLFGEMINMLVDEFRDPITNLYYQFEEERAERDQIKTHKLRNLINSILFELNNSYKDGWTYETFEKEFRSRSTQSTKIIKQQFQKLIEQKEVRECSPGLYLQIIGFDRYS